MAELIQAGGMPGGTPVPIGEIARRRDIPVQFLEQLFANLRRGGILQSQRGVKGGYCFALDPAEVTVLAVVEQLDGEVGCETKSAGPVFQDAAAALRAVLAKTTIADVAQREAELSGAQMYYI